MTIKAKYFLFLTLTLIVSLGLFVGLTLRSYSEDKISFIKEKASQDVVSLARNLSTAVISSSGTVDLTLLYSDKVQAPFAKEDISDKFLINKEGLILAGEERYKQQKFQEVVSLEALQKINLNTISAGLIETTDINDKKILVAYSNVPQTDLFVIQSYELGQLERFLKLFLIKVFFSFLAIGSFFMLTGFLVVSRFTKTLEDLRQSANRFGAGDYQHRVKVLGQDEVASLSAQFNKMADKVCESLLLEGEKARLQLEMETAQKVQETLFLPNSYKKRSLELAGYYEPASECGGDWWYYFEKEDSFWVCFGDVTGHGVGSAMLVSSVRAVMTLLERQEELTPACLLQKLNQAIFESLGGKLQMTFCVLQIFPDTGKVRYANASHEFPMCFKKKTEVSKDEISFLSEANGPRLGQALQSTYQDTEVLIEKGSRFLLFSDGIYDVKNKEEKAFGERRFFKTILKANAIFPTAQKTVQGIFMDIQSYRQGTALVDDISLICVDMD